MKIPFINLDRQHADISSDIIRVMAEVFGSGIYLNGPQVDAFAEEWAQYCGQEYCIPCASGTDALSIMTVATGLMHPIYPANTTPFTMRGIRRGLHSRGVHNSRNDDVQDVDEEGWPVSWRGNTVPVLLYGRQLLPGMMTINFVDACQAHGWKPKKDFHAAWSFYPTKNLGAFGDAGAITTDNKLSARLARNAAALWHSRMSEMNAAVLRVKLPHLDRWNFMRHWIAETYWNELPGQVTPACPPGWLSNHHIFAILTDRRGELIDHLAECGIGTKIHYPEPLAPLPGATRWCNRTLSLPCYPGLTREEVRDICDAIRIFFK